MGEFIDDWIDTLPAPGHISRDMLLFVRPMRKRSTTSEPFARAEAERVRHQSRLA